LGFVGILQPEIPGYLPGSGTKAPRSNAGAFYLSLWLISGKSLSTSSYSGCQAPDSIPLPAYVDLLPLLFSHLMIILFGRLTSQYM